MNRFLISLMVVSAALLASCSSVHTLTPVEKETELSLQGEFEGFWRMSGCIFHVAFDEDGFGRFAWAEWEANEFVATMGKREWSASSVMGIYWERSNCRQWFLSLLEKPKSETGAPLALTHASVAASTEGWTNC